jgi:hypothetical protein
LLGQLDAIIDVDREYAAGDGSEEKSWAALSPPRPYFFDGINARASSVRCSASSYGSIALPSRIYQDVIFGKAAGRLPKAIRQRCKHTAS